MFRDRACLIITGEPSPQLPQGTHNRSYALTDGCYPLGMTTWRVVRRGTRCGELRRVAAPA
ncbi:hypothetical protein A8H35_31545 [Burkholderia thailandensis]|nr:hypothetical protein A8H31_01480 [Burkholderia thailandensis]AWY62448.1 hypothetical protein A8H35_31545 [Burkholderia thailandensis]AWY64493.1 hypothetical protein A8H36_03760 [Burkholderia thailandensis]NOK42192.1 hypothetical protein [Burkholderia thailandensis]NOK53827.1 hypothetical protein [Burkholderia thailandensis]